MATASSFFNEEQFECPICTDIFKDPVSLPCGHNFCNACIQRHRKDKDKCQCPLCKQVLDKSLKLSINTLFRDVVDSYKHELGSREEPLGAGDVLCDCCLHTRRRATKTCLVCLTSYCDTHLEPHFRVASLKQHKLTDPLPKLEEKTCTKHNRVFEENSSSDQKPICALCAYDEIQEKPDRRCHDTKAQAETQHKDVPYIKESNAKKRRKAKNNNEATKMKTAADEAEAESLENVHIWHNNQLYSFSPLPLQCGFSSGRVYFDVPILANSNWELGVVNKKMRRPGVFSTGPCGKWVIHYNRHIECTTGCPLNKLQFPDRVLVCVDYKQGRMFLVHPFDGIVFFCLENCRFQGNLFLFTRNRTREPLAASIRGCTSAKGSWVIFVAFVLVFFLNIILQ